MNANLNPMVLNANATKRIRCPGCLRPNQRFTINAGAWCCDGCGWVIELTAAEKKKHTFKSSTIVLANYLFSLGYPVEDLNLERASNFEGVLAGSVVVIDTNPKKDPTLPRRVLEIVVSTYGKEISYDVYAIKFTTKGRKVSQTVYRADDLMKLSADIQTQHEIADLVVNRLGLKPTSSHFDVTEMALKLDVAYAVERLNVADKALADYQKGGRKC